MTDIPLVVAETLAQDAHIPEKPELNPEETAFDSKKEITRSRSSSISSLSSSILLPQRRRRVLHPPIPDLRFEQSYLKSIEAANGDWKKILWITFRDHFVMTFVQGFAVALGWKAWAKWRNTWSFKGRSLGVRLRRWWWRTNNWPIPGDDETPLAAN